MGRAARPGERRGARRRAARLAGGCRDDDLLGRDPLLGEGEPHRRDRGRERVRLREDERRRRGKRVELVLAQGGVERAHRKEGEDAARDGRVDVQLRRRQRRLRPVPPLGTVRVEEGVLAEQQRERAGAVRVAGRVEAAARDGVEEEELHVGRLAARRLHLRPDREHVPVDVLVQHRAVALGAHRRVHRRAVRKVGGA